jgi:glycine oxidase
VSDPFFSWLPFTPNVGEVLDVELPADALPTDVVLNQSVYVVPQPGQAGRYRVGATYDWRTPPPARPTAAGRADLLDRLGRLVPLAATVVAHRAARRPAVQDRRPLLGPHPAHPRLWLFNGFGSKGVGLAPGLAAHLRAVLEGQETLWPEVNLARFAALYPKS